MLNFKYDTRASLKFLYFQISERFYVLVAKFRKIKIRGKFMRLAIQCSYKVLNRQLFFRCLYAGENTVSAMAAVCVAHESAGQEDHEEDHSHE